MPINILNTVVFIILLFILHLMARKKITLSKRVFSALFLGIVLGVLLNYLYQPEELTVSFEIFNIVAKGYIALLKMVALPLIMMSILSAIVNLEDVKKAGQYALTVILILLGTAMIASIVSAIVTLFYQLNANGILKSTQETLAAQEILQHAHITNQSLSSKIISFIPQNPFLDMTGARPTSMIALVMFSIFSGGCILSIKSQKPQSTQIIIDLINAVNEVVLKMVRVILQLTPYGVLALILNAVSSSHLMEILKLIQFVLASYTAIIIMYVIHLLIVAVFGLSAVQYIKKTLSTLIFAFTSRSSAGTIPLTIKSQESMGVDKGIANIAATFGASIGQNGCAAIYPTMLALMIAPSMAINPYDLMFIIKVVLIVTISSLGVAGVGGGATFAAIIVLSILDFPIELAGLLISIEPIIDMGRTALNVNDSILSGLISAKILKKLDKKQFDKPLS